MPILRKKKSQINSLTVHIKELEKREQTKPKVTWRKEIRKITMEIIDTATKRQQKRNNGLIF